MNYWHLELWDKEIIKIAPKGDNVINIQNELKKPQGTIVMPDRVINIKNIKEFRLSDEHYTDQKLLEETSLVFNDPQLNKDGSVKSRYVKKGVPRRKWDTFYRYNSAYKMLGEDGNYVMIAFIVPVHQIDHSKVQELTPNDLMSLSKRT